jgi:hypothetical protein
MQASRKGSRAECSRCTCHFTSRARYVPKFEVLYKPLSAMVTVLYRPIHLDELLALMDLRDQDGNPVLTENIMDTCGMFLSMQGDVVHFSHQSARDFLAQSTRILPSGPKDGYRLIKCLSSIEDPITPSVEMWSSASRLQEDCGNAVSVPMRSKMRLPVDRDLSVSLGVRV